VRTLEGWVVDDELDDGRVSLRGVDVVLDIHRAEHLLGWEAVDLAVGDRTHECGLAAAVVAAQAVAVATLEVQPGVVEENLGTCNQAARFKQVRGQNFQLILTVLY
jgi:hypothetical protein